MFKEYELYRATRCVISNGSLSIYWSSIHFFIVLMAVPAITLITFDYLNSPIWNL
jgi:hypothetical protein